LACRNTALTHNNVARLREEIGAIDRELDRRPRLPPLLGRRLTARREMITTFLDRHAPERP
jgi:hypothetical protein